MVQRLSQVAARGNSRPNSGTKWSLAEGSGSILGQRVPPSVGSATKLGIALISVVTYPNLECKMYPFAHEFWESQQSMSKLNYLDRCRYTMFSDF